MSAGGLIFKIPPALPCFIFLKQDTGCLFMLSNYGADSKIYQSDIRFDFNNLRIYDLLLHSPSGSHIGYWLETSKPKKVFHNTLCLGSRGVDSVELPSCELVCTIPGILIYRDVNGDVTMIANKPENLVTRNL